ncbi:hypothetical protein Tco_1216565 [Tanacetum coccineum]
MSQLQGDYWETSNDPTQAKRNEFEELYASANEELYPGCDHVTRLDFMAKFTYFKVKGYKLPPSYYAIKKTFKTIGLGYESIHACVNDCFLFRGDANKDVHFCPVCNTSRWKDSNTPGKKVPKKVLRYFPIIPRLQRLYKSSHTAKEMTWHATGKCTEPGKMQHPVDGRAWKDFDTKYPDFAAEPRNVRLGLAADGFNPFGNLSQSYSMWPVILTTYNLPPWLCMKESSFMLTLLIPGPKSPGKDIDVYLRPLIDDLKDLWAKPGVETIDVATGLKFNMRAMVLWTINDFPARSSLSGWSGQGYKACPTCNEDTPSVRVLGKTAYVGHKRFLKKPHKWRRSLEFNGETENEDPPREFSQDAIMTQLARLPTLVKGKHPEYKSKDTAKAKTRLEKPGHSKWLVLGKTKTGRFLNVGVNCGNDDPDVIHVDNSSDLSLSTSLNDLEIAALHIDGQSIDVDAPPDIIDVIVMLIRHWFTAVTWKVMIVPLHNRYPPPVGVLLRQQVRAPEMSNFGGREWQGLITRQTQFDLRPHMESDRWPQIYAGIQQHLQKIYNGKKAALKERYWVPEEDGTYDLERLRRGRPSHISEINWDAQLAFWNDPKNRCRAFQNKQNRAKSKVCLGSTPPSCEPYTDDENHAIERRASSLGTIPRVGRVLPGQGTVIPPPSQSTHSTDIARLKKREKQLTKQVNNVDEFIYVWGECRQVFSDA